MRTRHKEPVRSFLLGALVGAAVAFLLAPAPGRDTRALVVREAEHTAAATRQLGEQVVRKGREALAGVASTLDRIAHR
jgi:gas vesicle protein